MQRYFLHLAYQGFNYRGWQQQPGDVRTVQGTIEDCLSRVLRQPTTVIGCGRTDAQVHASQYVLHFNTDKALPEDFVFILNKTLPDSISVFECIAVPFRAHARYDATERQYDYLIHTQKQAFLGQLSSLYEPPPIYIEAMREAAARLPEYEDFRGYCLKPDQHNTTLCEIRHTAIYASEDGQRIRFQISANRFLRGMVRILVHHLVLVGQGQLTLKAFEQPLRERQPPQPLRAAYPQGLYLSRVSYPFLELPARVDVRFERS